MSKPWQPFYILWEGSYVGGTEYVASYTDLMNAFGAVGERDAGIYGWGIHGAGIEHYFQHGQYEGRVITFDGLEYIASYEDLISALGANELAGATHYIRAGRFEGRTTNFDGLEYMASYGDLIDAFGSEVAAYPDWPPDWGSYLGAKHFIENGHSEGRTVSFDPAQYLANYADLRAAFGADTWSATQHYIIAGYAEGRTDDAI